MLPYKSSAFALVEISLREKEKRAEKGKSLSLEVLLTDVCVALGMPLHEVVGKNRKREVVICRHIFCYVAYLKTPNSLKTIGELLGNRDHTTVINAREVVKDLMQTEDEKFMAAWNRYLERSTLFTQNDFR